MRKRHFLDFKGGEGSVFELAEAPFVRVGDEFDGFRLDDFIAGGRIQRLDLYFLVGDEHSRAHQRLVQTRIDQPIIILLVDLVYLAIEHARGGKYIPAWVSK